MQSVVFTPGVHLGLFPVRVYRTIRKMAHYHTPPDDFAITTNITITDNITITANITITTNSTITTNITINSNITITTNITITNITTNTITINTNIGISTPVLIIVVYQAVTIVRCRPSQIEANLR